MDSKNNLICVHSGTSYGPEYVLNLWQGARRNSRDGFDFYVFTDNIKQHPQDLGWNFVKLPDWREINGFKPWWYKLEIFNYQHQLEGKNLYVDLDVVIVNNIDCFWKHSEDFCICQDFNRAFSNNIGSCNSSIMSWHNNSMSYLYSKFSENMQYIVHKYRGDQDYIQDETKNSQIWWPREWAMSWKWEILHGGQLRPHGEYRSVEPYIIPDDTRMIVCHGKPNPHEIVELYGFWNK